MKYWGPVKVEAIQYTGEGPGSHEHIMQWLRDVQPRSYGATWWGDGHLEIWVGSAPEEEGVILRKGHWLVQGPRGEMYALHPDVFDQFYKPAIG